MGHITPFAYIVSWNSIQNLSKITFTLKHNDVIVLCCAVHLIVVKLWNRLDVSHWYGWWWLKPISYEQNPFPLSIFWSDLPVHIGTYAGTVLMPSNMLCRLMCVIHKINRIILTIHVLMCASTPIKNDAIKKRAFG